MIPTLGDTPFDGGSGFSLPSMDDFGGSFGPATSGSDGQNSTGNISFGAGSSQGGLDWKLLAGAGILAYFFLKKGK